MRQIRYVTGIILALVFMCAGCAGVFDFVAGYITDYKHWATPTGFGECMLGFTVLALGSILVLLSVIANNSAKAAEKED